MYIGVFLLFDKYFLGSEKEVENSFTADNSSNKIISVSSSVHNNMEEGNSAIKPYQKNIDTYKKQTKRQKRRFNMFRTLTPQALSAMKVTPSKNENS